MFTDSNSLNGIHNLGYKHPDTHQKAEATLINPSGYSLRVDYNEGSSDL